VERLAAILTERAWVVSPGVTSAIYADRGSIEVLAFHLVTRVVVVVASPPPVRGGITST
jgi:hypothetical protein